MTRYTTPVAKATEVLAIHLVSDSIGIEIAANKLRQELGKIPAGVENTRIANMLINILDMIKDKFGYPVHMTNILNNLADICDKLGV